MQWENEEILLYTALTGSESCVPCLSENLRLSHRGSIRGYKASIHPGVTRPYPMSSSRRESLAFSKAKSKLAQSRKSESCNHTRRRDSIDSIKNWCRISHCRHESSTTILSNMAEGAATAGANKVRMTLEIDLDTLSVESKSLLFEKLCADEQIQTQARAKLMQDLDRLQTRELQNVVKAGWKTLCKRHVTPQINLDAASSSALKTYLQRTFDLLNGRGERTSLKLTRGRDEELRSMCQDTSAELNQRGLKWGLNFDQLSDRSLASTFEACWAQIMLRDKDMESIGGAGFEFSQISIEDDAIFQASRQIIKGLAGFGRELPFDPSELSDQQLGIFLWTFIDKLGTSTGNSCGLDRFRPHHLISVIEVCCAFVVSKGYHLPAHIIYHTRVRPSLLNMPQELLDHVYAYCGFTHQVPESHRPAASGYTLRVAEIGLHESDGRPAKRRRTSRSIMNSTESSNMPNILLKVDSPKSFPGLAFVCTKFREELIAGAFAKNPLGIKVDCTQLDLTKPIANFWERLLPSRHLDVIHALNIEIRCSIEQWRQMKEALCGRLYKMTRVDRGMVTRARVKIRAFLDFPTTQQESDLDALPSWIGAGLRRAAERTWFEKHTATLDQDFKSLQNIACIQEIHLLNLRSKLTLPTTALIRCNEIEYPIVQYRTSEGWETIRRGYFDWSRDLHGYVKVELNMLQDM